ncbi:MAG: ribonuclease III [Syntrophomonadaceae bacterium]|nr:ribonuclease III [Syntrophomonadaceae bacterium]
MSNDINNARRFLRDNDLKFNDEKLMQLALMHPSYSQEKHAAHSNQRLEFLGDSVLNFIIAEYLYTHYQDKAEGELTKIRAKVVCEKALVNVARKINLGDYLLLGKGEEMSGGRKRNSILADTLEAVIGAIYLDQGFNVVKNFIIDHLKDSIKEAASGNYSDYKSRLQEYVQGKYGQNVSYKIIKESGPAHAKNFTAGVYYDNNLLTTGSGKSKKEAEQNAAKKVLDNNLLANIVKDWKNEKTL